MSHLALEVGAIAASLVMAAIATTNLHHFLMQRRWRPYWAGIATSLWFPFALLVAFSLMRQIVRV